MTEIFITNIQAKVQADTILNSFKKDNPNLKINYDLNDTELTFPCGHTILRVKGNQVNPENILTSINNLGFKCETLEDKICL
jgi:very-short-patch-repair endonuclease